MDVSLIATDGGSSQFERSFTNQSMLSYQVGEIDENGFVCIGIEERKVRGRNGRFDHREAVYASGSYSDYASASDYSSSEEYSSASDAHSRQSQYKKSLDFLVE